MSESRDVGRTTAWVGVCFVVTALVQALAWSGFGVPFRHGVVVPVASTGTTVAAAVVLAAGFVVAALGAPHERGLAGASAPGRLALLVRGVGALLLAASGLPLGPAVPPVQVILVEVGIQAVVLAAGVVAAVAVVRAGVLGPVARWALLPFAVAEVALALPWYSPFPDLVLRFADLFAQLEPLKVLLLLAAGVALLLAGRSAAVGRRLRAAKDAW